MMPDAASTRSTGSALQLLVLSCLLFAYVAVRAWVIPITWDEAYSYLEFTRKGILSPFQFPSLAANNHFLNTWLTYVSTGLLGVSEFTLRLPALIGHLLFLYYTARLCNEWSSPLLRVSGFVVLNVNPYLLDFFSLSRGYGIAYGLLAGSLWYLYRFLRSGLQARYAHASIGLAMLGVTAHLTLLHFLIALLVVILLTAILFAPAGLTAPQSIAHGLRRTALPAAIVGAFLIPTAVVVKGLRNADAFYWGGTASFWESTVVTVFDGALYEKQYLAPLGTVLPAGAIGLSRLLGAVAVLVVLLAGWVSVRTVTRHRDPCRLFLPALVVLLASCWIASVGQHHVLDVPYLTRRTALYLLVLFAFVFVGLAAELGRANKAWEYCLAVVAIAAAVHSLNCLNLRYVLEWKLAADVKEMVRDLARAKSDLPVGKVNTTVGLNLEFEAPLNYYRLVDHLGWLNVADRRTKYHPLNDFFLYSDADWRPVTADSFVVLKTYPLNNSRLVRRRSRPLRYDVRLDETLDFEAPADSMTTPGKTTKRAAYSGTRSGVTSETTRRSGGIIARLDVAAVPPQQSMVAVTAMVWMKSLQNAHALLVVQFSRDARVYSSHYLTVQDGALQARTWFPVSLTCLVPAEVQEGDRVSVFLWNDRDPVYVDDLRMQWSAAVY